MLLDHRRFLAGDPLTAQLFHDAARQWARRFFVNPVDFESVVQQALLEMTTRLQGGEQPEADHLIYWIHGCTNNVVRRELRRRRQQVIDTYESGIHGRAPIDISQAAELRRELEHLERALQQCSDKMRMLLEARIRGVSYRELAKIYGMSEGTVRESVSRLRKHLIGELTALDKAEYLMQLAKRVGLEPHASLPDESTASPAARR